MILAMYPAAHDSFATSVTGQAEFASIRSVLRSESFFQCRPTATFRGVSTLSAAGQASHAASVSTSRRGADESG